METYKEIEERWQKLMRALNAVWPGMVRGWDRPKANTNSHEPAGSALNPWTVSCTLALPAVTIEVVQTERAITLKSTEVPE